MYFNPNTRCKRASTLELTDFLTYGLCTLRLPQDKPFQEANTVDMCLPYCLLCAAALCSSVTTLSGTTFNCRVDGTLAPEGTWWVGMLAHSMDLLTYNGAHTLGPGMNVSLRTSASRCRHHQPHVMKPHVCQPHVCQPHDPDMFAPYGCCCCCYHPVRKALCPTYAGGNSWGEACIGGATHSW